MVELVVPELESALAFYAVPGFSVERHAAGFVALRGHGCRLFLARDPTVRSPSVQGCNLRIVVDDVDAVYRQLLEAGVAVAGAPADRDYGLRDSSVRDPNEFGVRFAGIACA